MDKLRQNIEIWASKKNKIPDLLLIIYFIFMFNLSIPYINNDSTIMKVYGIVLTSFSLLGLVFFGIAVTMICFTCSMQRIIIVYHLIFTALICSLLTSLSYIWLPNVWINNVLNWLNIANVLIVHMIFLFLFSYREDCNNTISETDKPVLRVGFIAAINLLGGYELVSIAYNVSQGVPYENVMAVVTLYTIVFRQFMRLIMLVTSSYIVHQDVLFYGCSVLFFATSYVGVIGWMSTQTYIFMTLIEADAMLGIMGLVLVLCIGVVIFYCATKLWEKMNEKMNIIAHEPIPLNDV